MFFPPECFLILLLRAASGGGCERVGVLGFSLGGSLASVGAWRLKAADSGQRAANGYRAQWSGAGWSGAAMVRGCFGDKTPSRVCQRQRRAPE